MFVNKNSFPSYFLSDYCKRKANLNNVFQKKKRALLFFKKNLMNSVKAAMKTDKQGVFSGFLVMKP
jgi:hypothetical protein